VTLPVRVINHAFFFLSAFTCRLSETAIPVGVDGFRVRTMDVGGTLTFCENPAALFHIANLRWSDANAAPLHHSMILPTREQVVEQLLFFRRRIRAFLRPFPQDSLMTESSRQVLLR